MPGQAKAESASPRFTLDLYEGMKRRGLLLDDFLEEQLRTLREQWPEAVDSGLSLDLLFFHTTPLGTAETRSAAEVAERYRHLPEIPKLGGHCKDRYLLAEGEHEWMPRAESCTTRRATTRGSPCAGVLNLRTCRASGHSASCCGLRGGQKVGSGRFWASLTWRVWKRAREGCVRNPRRGATG